MSGGRLLDAEICKFEAWRAAETANISGWVLRATAGGGNRINSVWPPRYDGQVPLGDAIDAAEAFYRTRGLPPRFMIMGIAEPARLDQALADRGYVLQSPCDTLVKAVGGQTAGASAEVSDECPRDWLHFYMESLPPAKAREIPEAVARIAYPRAFVVMRLDGVAAAIALGVKVGEDVDIDCVLTRSEFRRRGLAETAVRSVEAWAGNTGARRLVLAVLADNAPALGLYAKLGFKRLTGYHYRVLEERPAVEPR